MLSCVALLAACSKQGEGERCDLNSGNLDCDVGLVCRSAEQLSITGGRGVAICCPPDDVEPSENACRAGARLPDELRDAGLLGRGGSAGSGSADSGL